jgi:GNAT superfamily N-acetyltransferase
VRVRVVEAADEAYLLPELVALDVRSKASWGYDAAFMETFAATMTPTALVAPSRTTLVAEADRVLLGYAIVDDLADVAWLEDLWVEPVHCRQGVGRALLAAAIDVARARGRRALDLESDPHAEPFYLREGARHVGERASTIQPGRQLPLLRFDLTDETDERAKPRAPRRSVAQTGSRGALAGPHRARSAAHEEWPHPTQKGWPAGSA